MAIDMEIRALCRTDKPICCLMSSPADLGFDGSDFGLRVEGVDSRLGFTQTWDLMVQILGSGLRA